MQVSTRCGVFRAALEVWLPRSIRFVSLELHPVCAGLWISTQAVPFTTVVAMFCGCFDAVVFAKGMAEVYNVGELASSPC